MCGNCQSPELREFYKQIFALEFTEKPDYISLKKCLLRAKRPSYKVRKIMKNKSQHKTLIIK